MQKYRSSENDLSDMINLNLTFLSCFTSQFYKWKDWNDQAQQLGEDDDGDDDDDDDCCMYFGW